MYTNKGIGKGLGLKQIVSIAVIAVCMLTMILPWVHIGIRTTDGDMLDINTLMDMKKPYLLPLVQYSTRRK